ncbi:MAG: lysine exporter LysO family protein [Muribaculaceae bacterium]|nr:lysine exporter LysO family protein [Muribaculaceae bacterium]
MKGSLLIILVFAIGLLTGYSGILSDPTLLTDFSMPVLYVLIAIIGFEFGHKNLVPTLKKITRTALVLPFLTIGGSLLAAIIAFLLLGGHSIKDYLAMSSGLGYYSLAPLLIIDFKKTSVGIDAATELATITLMANMVREITSLTCAPLFRRFFGFYSPIAAAGVASIDVVLPVIVRTCGNSAIPLAIVQGVILEIGVPALVFIFC